MTETKPKRKRRTKEEIRLDNLKIMKEKFEKEYPSMSKVLNVQEVAKLLKLGIKEVRQKCIDKEFECIINETEKNQFYIDTYQFIDNENFIKFIDKYMKDKVQEEEINQVIKTTTKKENKKIEENIKEENNFKKDVKKNKVVKDTITDKENKVVKKSKEVIKDKDKTNLKDEESLSSEDTTKKRKRRTKKEIEEEKNKLNVVVEDKESSETHTDDLKGDKSKDEEDIDFELKSSNKVLNKILKSKTNQSVFRKKEPFQIPYVVPTVHYEVNDKVMLFKDPIIGEDLDEETMDYIEYYKKHLLGKKGIIKSISYTVDGHPIYLVYFEKQRDEMYCYHHYLTWLNK